MLQVNDYYGFIAKTLAPGVMMFRKDSPNQLKFEDFYHPFGGKLNSENRWVILANSIDWQLVEDRYAKNFTNSKEGKLAKNGRMAFGSLIIKERLGLSDRETVEQISENSYMQFFIGLGTFQDQCPFCHTSLTYFRKRFTKEDFDLINAKIITDFCEEQEKQKKKSSKKDNDDSGKSNGNGMSSDNENNANKPEVNKPNQGKLIVDATCTPADIAFPTDLNLLNKAREITEQIIDKMHEPSKGEKQKPRTYRNKARKKFLEVAKRKKPGVNKIRKAIRQQLGFVGRNLKCIERLKKDGLLIVLDNMLYRKLLVVSELYRQQLWMYENKSHQITARITSICQPHIRPMIRGKARNKVEFGAKVSISLVDGFCYCDTINFESYNESTELIDQIESYKKREGCYPESVHADQIYRTKNNRKFCKTHGVRLSGPALGRPSADKEKRKTIQQQQYQDEVARIPVEGKFGQGKRRFSLGLIMSKLAETSVSTISLTFIIMNLEKILKMISFCAYFWLRSLRQEIVIQPKAISFARMRAKSIHENLAEKYNYGF